MRTFSAAALFLISALPSLGAVIDSSASGFTVKIAVTIQGSPDEVYQKFVRNVGDWWNPQHTFSGKSQNLSIEDKPLGCWCEKIGDKGGTRHMQVITAVPGKALVFSGGLGPMQGLAIVGTMNVDFTAANGVTKFELTYSAAGYMPAGLNTLADPSDVMLTDQVNRLKNFVEIGRPVPPSQ